MDPSSLPCKEMAGTKIKDPRKPPNNEISFSDLKELTDNFSNMGIIGGSTFSGLVYKGVLRDDMISVKKLDQEKSPLARDNEFGVQVQQHIMALKHDNIVEMVAFCREEKETLQAQGDGAELVESLLCYKYLPKGSLDHYIFGGPHNIDWNTRFQIIQGICHGLRYLHTLDMPVIHMDLKPDTILLDENMSPKIADFGLARSLLYKTRETEYNVVRTCGNIAPEYLYNGEISTRTDIYSLGILILQITTGEKNPPTEDDHAARRYIKKILGNWTLGHIASVYEMLSSELLEEVKVCIEVGLDCVQIDTRRRPSIHTIVDKLTERRTTS